jgi:hypothetical protein
VAVIALAIVMPARIVAARVPCVAALIATGYQVFAINPRQAARARDRHSMSCAKSDTGDAHVLADLVRTDAVLARVHQTLI